MPDEKEKKDGKKEKRSWRDVVSSRNSDLNMDDDDAVATYMEGMFSDYDRIGKERSMMNDLLSSDPAAAGILTGLSSGVDDNGQPFSLTAYLLDNYYDEIMNSKDKEEAVERARKREAEKISAAAEEEKRRKKSADNLMASDQALDEAMNEANLDEAAVSGMLAWLYGDKDKENGFVYRIIRNEVSKDDWMRLLYAFNRDKDLSAARADGERSTRRRNPNPQRSLRDASVPSDLGGSGGTPSEKDPEDPTIQHYKAMKRRFT